MSIFTQLVKSVYSPKDMALFRFQKIGKTILYIMLLCLITTIPRTFFYGSFIQDSVTMVNQAIEKDLPDFKIENGELKADIEEPIQKEEEMLFSYLTQIQQILKNTKIKRVYLF